MIPLLLASAHAWSPLALCGSTPTHWDVQPSVWHLGRATPGASCTAQLTDDEVLAAQTGAWEVWSASMADCCNGWLSADGGPVDVGFDLLDETNTVSFAESDWDPVLGDVSLTLAITAPVWNVQSCGIHTADLLYNGVGFTFSTSDTIPTGAVDLQGVAAHENGHWLGLGHSEFTDATMYASFVNDIATRSLHEDDLLAVCDVYPGNCEGPQELCRNGIDDDSDGLLDCADDTCGRDPRCTCPADEPITCGTTLTASTAGRLATVDEYAVFDHLLPGPEAVYRLEIPEGLPAGPVVLELDGHQDDLVLHVGLVTSAGTCNAAGGLAAQGEHQAAMALSADAGEVYALTVDGTVEQGGDFALTVRCPGDVVERTCPVYADLERDVALSGHTADGASQIDTWACGVELPGPEASFRFVAPTAGEYRARLESDGLTLLVTDELDGACESRSCGVSEAGALGRLEAGEAVVLVVDGPEAGAFTLTVSGGSAGPSALGCRSAPGPWGWGLLVPLVGLLRRRAA